MAKPSVSNADHPDMIKRSLLMTSVTGLIGVIGLIAMLHWPVATSTVLIVLLVLLFKGEQP